MYRYRRCARLWGLVSILAGEQTSTRHSAVPSQGLVLSLESPHEQPQAIHLSPHDTLTVA